MKNMVFYTVILIVILILVGGYLGYNKYLVPSAKVIEYRDFSCPGMSGFTFKYPVFEGWEILKQYLSNRNSECIIELNFPKDLSFYQSPKIIVTETPEVEILSLHLKNSNNVSYNKGGEDSYGFRINKSLITISSPDYPKEGFSRDQFFKTVIESFKLVK